ncbi:hypothetical protein E1218_33490, partial [Kribbella turkmenica]
MSDNWNPPPEREPADGDQAAGPPEQPARDGQSPRWWSGSTDAKREFQDPSAAQGERPANNWFGEGWANRRPEDPDQDPDQGPGRQTRPEQSRGGPAWGGPGQGMNEQAGWQSPPTYGSVPQSPQTGPGADPHAGPTQGSASHAGPAGGPQQPGPQSGGRQSGGPQLRSPQAGG